MLNKCCAAAWPDRQRLWDLARYQRGELLEAGLVTPEEYADLLNDHAAVSRLEAYDEMRARIDAMCFKLQRVESERDNFSKQAQDLEHELERHATDRATARAELERLRTENAELRRDKERLDWLEALRLAINEYHETSYGWRFVASPNVNRLYAKGINAIDLHDAERRTGDIRSAIDTAMKASQ